MASGGNKTPQPPSPTPAVQAINAPSVFEKMAEQKFKKFTDWENADGPRDIMAAPGMDDMLDIYGSADSLQNQRKLSNPQMALSGGGSGDYAAQADQHRKMQQYDDRARGLSQGLQSVKNEAYGMGGDAATIEAERKNSYAQAMLQHQRDYWNRPERTPTWMKIAGLAIGGLGAAGGVGGLRQI